MASPKDHCINGMRWKPSLENDNAHEAASRV